MHDLLRCIICSRYFRQSFLMPSSIQLQNQLLWTQVMEIRLFPESRYQFWAGNQKLVTDCVLKPPGWLVFHYLSNLRSDSWQQSSRGLMNETVTWQPLRRWYFWGMWVGVCTSLSLFLCLLLSTTRMVSVMSSLMIHELLSTAEICNKGTLYVFHSKKI